jgi:hypothetical protein
MKSVYYNPSTMQVEAYLDSPNLVSVKNWENRGYIHALVPEGVSLTRDHKVVLDARGVVTGSIENDNPQQPSWPGDALRESGLAKLYKIAGLTQDEIDALS